MRTHVPISICSILCALVAHSSAQLDRHQTNSAAFGTIGIAAYETNDYETARYWLQSAVYDVRILDRADEPDPWATVYLARMHYFGDGIERDLSLACALYETAVRANENIYQDSNSRAKFRRVLGGDPCQGVAGGADSAEVRALTNACFWPGMMRAQFPIANGWITIDRVGVIVQIGEQSRQSRLSGMSGCNTVIITPFAHMEVPITTGTRVRDFVYLFGYEGSYEGVNIIRTLHWYLFELSDNELQLRTNQSVERLQDARSPALNQRPELLENVNLRNAGNNAVSWSLPAWHLDGSLR